MFLRDGSRMTAPPHRDGEGEGKLMGYLHIENLYKNQMILSFKECYALEKIHGTSAHVGWKDGKVFYFSGGASHGIFAELFDENELVAKFSNAGPAFILYGEAYGGKMQGMSGTYGKELKFIVFDVRIGEYWLSVEKAHAFAGAMGFEFVDYVKIPTTLEAIDFERDKPSAQAVRNGTTEPKPREGIVLRPPFEVIVNNGDRIISKHKREDFKETKTDREVTDPDKLKILSDAEKIADEWVTEMRLTHVLDKLGNPTELEKVPKVISAMIEDVLREAAGEIVESKEAKRAIGRLTVELYKKRVCVLK